MSVLVTVCLLCVLNCVSRTNCANENETVTNETSKSDVDCFLLAEQRATRTCTCTLVATLHVTWLLLVYRDVGVLNTGVL